MEITGVNRELQTVSNINGYQGSSVNNTGYKNAGSGMDQTGGIAAGSQDSVQTQTVQKTSGNSLSSGAAESGKRVDINPSAERSFVQNTDTFFLQDESNLVGSQTVAGQSGKLSSEEKGRKIGKTGKNEQNGRTEKIEENGKAGKSEKAEQDEEKERVSPYDRLMADKAMEHAKERIRSMGKSAQFAYNKDIERYTITITDRENKEVIKEIPSEEIQKMIEHLHTMRGMMFDEGF